VVADVAGGRVADWTDGYYGTELYLASAADLLTPRLSAIEAGRIAELLGLGPGDRVLDLGCGHGRHARALAARVGWCCGLERWGEPLRRAGPPPARVSWLRADLRAPPFRDGSFDAAWSWYASLFMWEEEANRRALAGVARLLRRGGRLLVQHANPLALAREPHAAARRDLPDGGRVEETSTFDAVTGVDRCARRWVRPDGRALEGTAHLRYYSQAEWEPLARDAGLRLRAVTCTTPPPGGRPGPEAPDLIALLEKP
jgi:SAM-dependent methyltransferase